MDLKREDMDKGFTNVFCFVRAVQLLQPPAKIPPTRSMCWKVQNSAGGIFLRGLRPPIERGWGRDWGIWSPRFGAQAAAAD